jgi:hypothetical protein
MLLGRTSAIPGRCVQLMRRPKAILTLTITFVLTLLNSEPLFACSCDGESTVKEAVKYSDIVFKGRVVSKNVTIDLSAFGVTIKGDTTSNSFATRQLRNAVAVFKIKVDKIYKGKSQSDTITIITPTNPAGCGVSFQLGQNYIVYGTMNDETLKTNDIKRFSTNNKTYWTHLCTRTGLFFEGEEREINAVKK